MRTPALPVGDAVPHSFRRAAPRGLGGEQSFPRTSAEVLAGSKVITDGGWLKVIFPVQRDYHFGHRGNRPGGYRRPILGGCQGLQHPSDAFCKEGGGSDQAENQVALAGEVEKVPRVEQNSLLS